VQARLKGLPPSKIVATAAGLHPDRADYQSVTGFNEPLDPHLTSWSTVPA